MNVNDMLKEADKAEKKAVKSSRNKRTTVRDRMEEQNAEEGVMQPGGAATSEMSDDEANAMNERVVLAASKVLYDDATHDKLVEAMRAQAQQPDQALGTTAVMLIKMVDEKSQGGIPLEIIVHATTEVLELLGEIAQKAKLFTVDQGVLQRAAHIMLRMIGDEWDIDEEEIAGLINGMDPKEVEGIVAQESAYWQQGAQQAQGAA